MTIRLSAVRKLFGSHAAVDGVSLDIDDGEFFVVLGPSGCGKSTLLRAIAGLEAIDAGEIEVGGRRVAAPGLHVPPEARKVGVVFQSYALWPHMSVRQNVAFPLETAGASRTEVESRTRACLATVELTAFADRKPADLSGGQRQRVALARCLAQAAGTILMDEPLANLDPHLRHAMEEELAAFHAKSGSTTLFITHDQREAMALADRVALMWDGRLLQADSPDRLYERPANERVAGFIGRGTIVDARIEDASGGRAGVSWAGLTFEVAAPADARPGACRLLLRPEQFSIAPVGEGMIAEVTRATYRGGYFETDVRVAATGTSLLVNLPGRPTVGEGLTLRPTGGWVLPD